MTERIMEILKDLGVATWRVTESRSETGELYFVKKDLDIPRFKQQHSWSVEVFRDFTWDGKAMRGSSNALLTPGMSDAEIREKIAGAWYAASFVRNPFYELPAAVREEHRLSDSDLASMKPEEALLKMAYALQQADDGTDAFVNSAELFAFRSTKRILASNGLDVCFDSCTVSGELVAQCVAPRDVEQYRHFTFDRLDLGSLERIAREAVRDVRARARSSEPPKAGTYDVVLTGEHLRELLWYYIDRASASYIYPGYSRWEKGMDVQGETDGGEKLDLLYVPTDPYSEEGVPMIERTFLESGVLRCIRGNSRFCGYLGLEPTGSYGKVRCLNGTADLGAMLGEGVLEPVSFSDFQMDSFDGHFKGEIRLALLHHADSSVEELTGGSVNGCLPDVQGKLIFSKERYSDASYEGPAAVLIPGVRIAGA